MRDLTLTELDDVEGGVLVIGAVIGGVAAGGAAYLSGASGTQIAAATFLGAASGFFGGVAGVAAGAMRAITAVEAVGTGVLSSVVSTPTTSTQGT